MPPKQTSLSDMLEAVDKARLSETVDADFTDDDLEISKNRNRLGKHKTDISIFIRWFSLIIGVIITFALIIIGFKYLYIIYSDPEKLDNFVRGFISIILISTATMFVDRHFVNKDD